jgi:hypothetical protein
MDFLPIFGHFFMKGFPMSKNAFLSLGDYFDHFVSSQLESGRDKKMQVKSSGQDFGS